jgi:hypothetical protein
MRRLFLWARLKPVLSILFPVVFIGLIALLLTGDIHEWAIKHYQPSEKPTQARFYVSRLLYADGPPIDVLLVGGSSIRETFYNNYEPSPVFSSACNRPLKVLNAGSSNQNIIDSFAIIEAVGRLRGWPKVVVFGLTDFRLSLDWNNEVDLLSLQQTALPSPQIPQERLPLMQRAEWEAKEPFFAVKKIYELVRDGKKGPLQDVLEDQHFYDKDPKTVLEKLHQSLTWQSLGKPKVYANAHKSAQYLAAITRKYQEMGIAIVFYYTPAAPSTWKLLDDTATPMGEASRLLSEVAPVIDMRKDTSVPEKFFYDEQHFRPEGRRAFWKQKGAANELSRAVCAAVKQGKAP